MDIMFESGMLTLDFEGLFKFAKLYDANFDSESLP